MDIALFDKLKLEPPNAQAHQLLAIHIGGVAEGYEWANAFLQDEKKPPLFCAPQNFSLNADNYIKLVDDELTKNRRLYSDLGLPIGAILLRALKEKLPCAR